MSKAANGSGTVYKPKHPSKNLPFRAEVWITDNSRSEGKRRISKNFKKRSQAEQWRDEMIRKYSASNNSICDPCITLSQWLTFWLNTFALNIKDSTRTGYECYISQHIAKHQIGNIQLKELNVCDLQSYNDEHIYIKNDGSLHDGFEIVTHPMTLDYHLNDFYWEDILHKAVQLGYLSHQTTTCGLHVHVNRTAFGNDEISQDMAISRILYFVEQNWNELLKFSRRTESAMNRWASRFGYDTNPKKLLNKAKCTYGRYHAVNLCNKHTIEFRMFRGTLKLETLYATLQLVDRICELAVDLNDSEMQNLSWSEFVSYIDQKELINYLKRRRLYVNEPVTVSEDL